MTARPGNGRRSWARPRSACLSAVRRVTKSEALYVLTLPSNPTAEDADFIFPDRHCPGIADRHRPARLPGVSTQGRSKSSVQCAQRHSGVFETGQDHCDETHRLALSFGANLIEPVEHGFAYGPPRNRRMSCRRSKVVRRVPMIRPPMDGSRPKSSAAPERAIDYLLPDGTACPIRPPARQASDVHGASVVVDPSPIAGANRLAGGRGTKLCSTSCMSGFWAASPVSAANCRGWPISASPRSS